MSSSANSKTNNKSLSQHSKWRRKRQYSPQELLQRNIRSVIGKMTAENKPKLMPKILNLYNQIDNTQDFQTFIDIIIERAGVEVVFQEEFVDIFCQLISSEHKTISSFTIKQCISISCEKYYNKHSTKPIRDDDDHFVTDETFEWKLRRQKHAYKSIARLIGKLTASDKQLLGFGELQKYLSTLFEPILGSNSIFDEERIEIACCIFTEISGILKLRSAVIKDKLKWIKIKNVDMKSIQVYHKSYTLTYGYLRDNKYDHLPVGVINFCIGYYDINWEIFDCIEYYEKLKSINSSDCGYDYSTRIKFFVDDVTRICE